ncbi:unnamed protein product [Rhizophagus irregularis]|uniref:F-box domain-containing protein n=1 Tax=Rhizophagus irregularis TaxID=588596 RepID=A0A2I1GLG0_9GLOM|nr:hypothetical protein RhiirA4_462572 [Rhizophagus irregularis]CAB4435054.1 unnamed protein product [Rhizophagus irregularis]
MFKLDRDVLRLIFEELRDDEKTLCLCLSVNKAICETVVPILWKNPWKSIKKGKEKLLLNVIISHLSDESKNNLKNLGVNLLTNSYKKPLFNYISFCKHLRLCGIKKIINSYEESKISIINNEIFKLFINENMKYTHLYIPLNFDFQIHLIHGAKSCLSEIIFLKCHSNNDDNIVRLTEICKSIKEMELFIVDNNKNNEIIKLIEAQRKLFNVSLKYSSYGEDRTLENSLIKHANTIRYFKIDNQSITKFLLLFVNLRVLELHEIINEPLDQLKNITLPYLQILYARRVSYIILISLIKSTNGQLTEISFTYCTGNKYIEDKHIIQVIYQNCPNLKYLKTGLGDIRDILELENLLINCQYLDGLYLTNYINSFNFDNLFEILANLSPISLFKFKFDFLAFRLKKSLKLFFDNWKDRHPMLIQISYIKEYSSLMEEYKAEGIIKNYNHLHGEDFEWNT